MKTTQTATITTTARTARIAMITTKAKTTYLPVTPVGAANEMFVLLKMLPYLINIMTVDDVIKTGVKII